MEFRVSVIWSLFVIFSLFSPQARGEVSGSVFFIDGSNHQFLRDRLSIIEVEVLQEQYEAESIAQHEVEMLLATLTKIFISLQEAYEGQIVGVIYCHAATPQELGKKFDVTFAPHHAA